MKKTLLMGFMFVLLAFIVTPLKANPTLDVDVGYEQSDIIVLDAIQPEMILTLDIEYNLQIATPLKYPIVEQNYHIIKNFEYPVSLLTEMSNPTYVLNSNNGNLCNSLSILQTETEYNEGLFRLSAGDRFDIQTFWLKRYNTQKRVTI